jgi:acylphosphatase
MKENEPVNIRVKITGQKVHDVGYRYFLMNAAMSQRIERFRASNRMEKGLQTVDVALSAPLDAVAAFREFVGSEKPEDAAVSRVEFEDYEGMVPKLADFAQILTAGQLIKAIPVIQNHTELLTEIRDHTAETAENSDARMWCVPGDS